jgi:hypothetical protein
MPFDKTGTMIIKTLTASGALPIEGTVVRVIGAEEENRFVEYSILTDIDGSTKILTLPAPDREYSESPGAKESPYAIYNIEVSAPGYYTKRIYSVAVFDGIETIQDVRMIPIEIYENGVTYPRDNLITFVKENEKLE